ncbi:MAG: hypothetical protein SFH39_04770 [Candidatus Magnetobacterium sp. LHC-1]|nr:DUF1640 domain-containing protein [Nitrospirota bacterium]
MDAAIDTLKIYDRLKNANLDKKAAREIAEVIKDVTESSLATKGDLNKLQAELQAEIEKLRIEMKAEVEKLRAEIERAKVDTLKWVAAMMVAQAGFIVTLMRLFIR